MTRKALVLLLLTFVGTTSRAQYDMVFSHYFDLESSYNPAAAGMASKLNVNLAYSMQMMGFENKPSTAYIGGDLPIKGMGGTNGLGAQFFTDNIGLFTHQRIAVQYAYHKKLGKKGSIGIGAQAGLLTEKFDGSKLDLEDANDPAFVKSEVDGKGLDVAAGVHLQFPKWYLGISAQHLTFPTVELGEYNELKIDAAFFLTGGYTFQLPNPNFAIATSALVRTDLTAYRGDVTARVVYTHEEKRMYAGIGYSPMNSATLYIGGTVQGINLGYCYEAYTGIGMKHGAHEIRLGYQTELNLGKKGKNRHQSVRFL